jgi:hypothetical protein
MTGPWWLGISPVQAQVTCGGQQHRVRWASGELQALDHGDIESEMILNALGGHCACAHIMRLWAEHAVDVQVLVVTSRGDDDPVPDLSIAELRRRRRAPPRAHQREPGLAELLDLGGPVQDRLAATVAAAWRDPLRDGLARREQAALHAALYGRATAALRGWTRQPDLTVELTMISEDEPPALRRDPDGMNVRLPFGWIVDVWARGLLTVSGRFCLRAAPAEAGWILSTVGPELGPPALVAVGSPAEG